MRGVISAACGTVFGFGLAASGMTSRDKVLGFLDLFGNWIPDLLFVMASALIVKALAYHLFIKKRKPLLSESLDLPLKKQIDGSLISGSVIFGIGWGIHGFCPGPGFAALIYQDTKAMAFVLAMIAGMFLASLFDRINRKQKNS